MNTVRKIPLNDDYVHKNQGGFVIVNLDKGLFDGVYASEIMASVALERWRKRCSLDNIVLVQLKNWANLPRPDWLIPEATWMGQLFDEENRHLVESLD